MNILGGTGLNYGVTGDVTLSDSAANYDYIEIYYASVSDSETGYAQCSTKVWKPNGKTVWLSTGYAGASNANIKVCSALISGNKITRPYGKWEFNNDMMSATNYIGITKVLGYKKYV